MSIAQTATPPALWKGRSVTGFEQTVVERGLEEWSDVSLSWVQSGGWRGGERGGGGGGLQSGQAVCRGLCVCGGGGGGAICKVVRVFAGGCLP